MGKTNIYSNVGHLDALNGAKSVADSRQEVIQACKDAFNNPSSDSVKSVNDAIKEYARELAKSGSGLVAQDPLLGKLVGEVIDNAQPLQDYMDQNPESLQQAREILDRAKGRSDTYDNLVKDICGSQGIHNIQNELPELPESTFRWADPLVLDLDGDGIEISSDSVYFDTDGDGISNRMSWVNSDDGFLVFDKNNDGLISNGNELFGNDFVKQNGEKAVDGFDALSDLDSNGDSVIDTNDLEFSSLKVWRDLDQDGITDEGELFTLTELGISSFDLGFANSQESGNGYEVVSTSSISYADGSQSTLYDVNLERDTVHTKFDHTGISLSEEIASLMDLTGMGNVDSLQFSMAKNDNLKSLISTFESYDNRQDQLALMNSIVEAWASTDNADNLNDLISWQKGVLISSTGIDPETGRRWYSTSVTFSEVELSPELSKKINVLSAFYGMDQFSNIQVMTDNWANVVQAINDEYDRFTSELYTFFIQQSRLDKYTDLIEVDFNAETLLDVSSLNEFISNEVQNWQGDLTLIEDLSLLISGNPLDYSSPDINLYSYLVQLLSNTEITSDIELILDLAGFSLSSDGLTSEAFGIEIHSLFSDLAEPTQITSTKDVLIIGSEGADNITVNASNSVIQSGGGNDTIKGHYSANNTLDGGAGDDDLTLNSIGGTAGYGKQNTFTGGLGNDTLTGAASDDTYVFNLGDGQDTITDNGSGYSNNDKILFGEGITSAHLRLTHDATNTHLIIELLDDNGELTGDSITVQNAFNQSNYVIESFEFSDGSSMTLAEIKASSQDEHGGDALSKPLQQLVQSYASFGEDGDEGSLNEASNSATYLDVVETNYI